MSTLRSLDRALKILQILSTSENLLPLSVIANAANLPSSTTHRILNSLISSGYARQDNDNRNYGLGLMALSLAATVRKQFIIHDEAKPILDALANRVNETSTLVLFDGEISLYSMAGTTTRSIQTVTKIGTVVPMHATASGKAILSCLPENQLDRFLHNNLETFTKNTSTDPNTLREELPQIQKLGYAIDNEERETGMRCIASPVFDHNGNVCGAIGISGPSSRIYPKTYGYFTKEVTKAAHELSCQLGSKRK